LAVTQWARCKDHDISAVDLNVTVK